MVDCGTDLCANVRSSRKRSCLLEKAVSECWYPVGRSNTSAREADVLVILSAPHPLLHTFSISPQGQREKTHTSWSPGIRGDLVRGARHPRVIYTHILKPHLKSNTSAEKHATHSYCSLLDHSLQHAALLVADLRFFFLLRFSFFIVFSDSCASLRVAPVAPRKTRAALPASLLASVLQLFLELARNRCSHLGGRYVCTCCKRGRRRREGNVCFFGVYFPVVSFLPVAYNAIIPEARRINPRLFRCLHRASRSCRPESLPMIGFPPCIFVARRGKTMQCSLWVPSRPLV